MPAGALDKNIEFFVHNNCPKALYRGQIVLLEHLPENVLLKLHSEMLADKEAMKAICAMNLPEGMAQIGQYVMCRYGGFDGNPDFAEGKNSNAEYWDCGMRGKCPHEGKLCKLPSALTMLTPKEREVIKLTASGIPDKQIADALNMSEKTLPVHKRNIHSKLGIVGKSQLTAYAIQHSLA